MVASKSFMKNSLFSVAKELWKDGWSRGKQHGAGS